MDNAYAVRIMDAKSDGWAQVRSHDGVDLLDTGLTNSQGAHTDGHKEPQNG